MLDVRDDAGDEVGDEFVLGAQDRHRALQPPQGSLEGVVVGWCLANNSGELNKILIRLGSVDE